MSDRSSESDKPANTTPPADNIDRSQVPEPPEPSSVETNKVDHSDTAETSKSRRTAISNAGLETLSTGQGAATAGLGLTQAADAAGAPGAADAVGPFLGPVAQGISELTKQPREVYMAMANEAGTTAQKAARSAGKAVDTTVIGAAVEAASRREPPSALAGRPEYAEISTELPGGGDSGTTDALPAAIDDATNRTEPPALAKPSSEAGPAGKPDEAHAMPDYIVPGYERPVEGDSPDLNFVEIDDDDTP